MKLFFSHFRATLPGAVVGQVIPILAMPIISRLYTPGEYGIFAALMSFSIILTALTTMQMEVAVVLPEDDATGGKVARTAFQISVTIAVILTIVMALLQPALNYLPALARLQGWSILAPTLAFLMAMLLLGNYISARLHEYGQLGRSTGALQIINCTVATILGLFAPGPSSLLIARLTGQTAAVAAQTRAAQWLKGHYTQYGILSWTEMKDILSRYRKFPLFTLPHTLSSMTSRECVTIILAAFHQPVAAGFYALVRSVLMIPASLLSTTIGPIFYREASSNIDRPEFRTFSYELMLAIAFILAPGCMYIANWGPEIFAFVFGQQWAQAGIYAFVYMPVSMLFILSIWCGKVFEIRNRQDILFRIQLTFDILSIATLVLILFHTYNPIVAVAGYAVLQCLYLLTYLGFVFQLLNLPMVKYVLLLSSAALAAGAQEIIHKLTGLAAGGTWIHFAVESLIMAVVSTGTALFFWRLLKRSPVMHVAPDAV